jgi:hypothetical protein
MAWPVFMGSGGPALSGRPAMTSYFFSILLGKAIDDTPKLAPACAVAAPAFADVAQFASAGAAAVRAAATARM